MGVEVEVEVAGTEEEEEEEEGPQKRNFTHAGREGEYVLLC